MVVDLRISRATLTWAALVAAVMVVLTWAVPARAEDARFDILEYVVEGNTVLPALAIEEAVYPHLGEGKSIADAEAARLALEQAYHRGGFLTVFVNIPEQRVDSGRVRLHVVQGEVERLRVAGSRYFSLGRIKAGAPELSEGHVPYFPEVQKQLASLGKAADRKITPVLRAGREPGKVEVELKVEDKQPLHGTVELNDRYSVDTTHTRLSGSIRWDNLWQREHSLGISYQVAPEQPDDSKAISATYTAPLDSGHYLAAYAVHTDSDVASLGTLGVVGVGDIVGLRYILPLPGRPGLNHSLTLGVDYKDFSQSVRLLGADSFNTPISYLPFSLAWDAGLGDGADSTRLSLAANFHLRNVVGQQAEFANKRFRASPGYFYLRGSLDRTWTWPSGMALKVGADFQATDQPLISNEQFVLGGAESVRGYLESEAVGDRGLSFGLEWQSAPLRLAETAPLDRVRAILFLEAGHAAILDPLPAQRQRYTLSGAGFGLRLGGDKGMHAALDLAWPMRDGSRTRAWDGRVHASLGYGF